MERSKAGTKEKENLGLQSLLSSYSQRQWMYYPTNLTYANPSTALYGENKIIIKDVITISEMEKEYNEMKLNSKKINCTVKQSKNEKSLTHPKQKITTFKQI